MKRLLAALRRMLHGRRASQPGSLCDRRGRYDHKALVDWHTRKDQGRE